MKKFLCLLLTVLIGFSGLRLSAQSLTVANGTVTNPYIPVYGSWLDAAQHNQIIYPENMLTDLLGQTVNTMMFFLSSEPYSTWSSSVTLSVGTTLNTTLSSSSFDPSPVSQIYSGSMNISGGVLEFVLDSTFTYNGGNLLLDITTVAGNYSSANFYGVEQTSASVYQYNTYGGTQNFIPKTMFVYGNCLAPSALSVDSITETTALFTWQPGDQETSWDVFIGNGTEDLSDVTWIPVTTNSYDIDNLTANTVYTAYVRANCGTEYSYVVSKTFRTACGVTPVPFVEGFESFAAYTQPVCWQFINPYVAYSYTYPYVYSYNSYHGEKAMYFYPDYSGNPNAKEIAVLPLLSESITDLQLSLYTRRESEYSGTFQVGYVTDPTDENTFVALETRTATDMGDNDYHRVIVDFSNVPVDPDSVAYLAIAYQHDYYYGWYVDDIEVTLLPDCSTPVGLAVNDITTSTATLTWIPGTATTFNVYYKKSNDTVYTEELAVSDTFLLIEDLAHSSIYQWYVVSVCDDGSLQTSEEKIFVTSCSTIDTLPYVIDFESTAPNTTLPLCWTRGGDDATYPYVYDYAYYAYQGSGSLDFYYTNTAALPQLSDEIDIQETQISFYAYAYTSGTSLQVGVMSNPNVASSFVPVGTINLTDEYAQYDVSFADYTGVGKYIAFKNPDESNSLYLDLMTLDFLPECSRPASVWVQSLDSSSATIAWSSVEDQNSWEVVIGQSGFNPDTVTPVTVNAPTTTFDNLAANASYNVYVRTLCGEDVSPWSNVLSFITLTTVPAELPYICTFEDPAENANWTFVQDYQPNQWYIDTAIVGMDSSLHTMYISSDSGATNSYNITGSTVSWAYRDIYFSEANEFELSFDWRGYGESSYDYMRVYIGSPAPVSEGDNTLPTGAIQLANLNQSYNWEHATFSMGASYSNTTKRLYFMWRNDGIIGTQPPAAVDNIMITPIACAQPLNMVLSNVDTSSATISFVPGNEGDEEWEVMYGTSDTTMIIENVTTTTFTIDNLAPATEYSLYLRTLCADGDTSAWTPALTFQTECVVINSVPRFWDFESNNIGGTNNNPLPACWNRGTSSSYPYVYDYSYYAYEGSHCLYFYNSYKNLAIMPAIDIEELPINTLQVSFYAKASSISSYNAQLIVGVVSDIYDNNTFVPVDTIELTEDFPSMPYVVMFNNYTGNANRIAFKNNSSSMAAYNSIYLDNLTLEELPNCLPVGNLVVESSDTTSVTLNWTPGFEESSWNVEYKEVSDSVWNTVVANSIPFTLDNLTIATPYDIRVQADCGGDVSPWIYTQANTQVCDAANQCTYTFVAVDSYGDGWNGGYLSVMQNGIEVARVAAENHHQSSTLHRLFLLLC